MACAQMTIARPTINPQCIALTCRPPSMPCFSPSRATIFSDPSLALVVNASSCQQLMPMCLFGGKEKGKPGNDNEGSPWDSLGKGMGSFKKESSVEELLRKQMEKQEYYDDGGSMGNPPRDGGDGNGGDSDEPEDEGLAGILDELVQVVLATLGFIFLYIYIINGEELTRLAKDYIKYMFGGNKSVRLKRAMYMWGRFWKRLTAKEAPLDPYWLEKEIINTNTWWDSPEKYRRVLRRYIASAESASNE